MKILEYKETKYKFLFNLTLRPFQGRQNIKSLKVTNTIINVVVKSCQRIYRLKNQRAGKELKKFKACGANYVVYDSF